MSDLGIIIAGIAIAVGLRSLGTGIALGCESLASAIKVASIGGATIHATVRERRP